MSIAIGAVIGVMAVGVLSARSYAAEQQQLTATTVGLGAASGLSAAALTEAAQIRGMLAVLGLDPFEAPWVNAGSDDGLFGVYVVPPTLIG